MTSIANTAAAAAPAVSAATTPNAATSLSMTATDFLTLLTTQLQNQDPLNPTDPSQFTDQLVQINSVEQETQTNATLDKILAGQNGNAISLGVGYIGMDVQAPGGSFSNSGGQPVNLAYNMPAAATSGAIAITNSAGGIVYEATPSLTQGTTNFTWNGKDMQGNPVPAGTYNITAGAQNAAGQALNVTTYVPNLVTGVETASDGTVNLNVGNSTVPISSVIGVSKPAS